MKTLLVLHGDPPPRRILEELPARIVAVDGAAHHVDAWRVRPDVLVGDMDSIHADLLDTLHAHGTKIVRHPVAKDATDGQLALDLVLDEGATEVVLTGATGGRLDHALANVHLLARAARRGVRARAVEAHADVWVAAPGLPVEVDLPAGAEVSVLPLGGDAGGVTITGAAWPTDAVAMPFGTTLGISNVASGGPFRVRVDDGMVLVVRPR